MGIFNDLKRMLFGAKAVGKSTAKKAAESIEHKKDELMDETEMMFEHLTEEFNEKSETAKAKAVEVKGKIKDEAKEIWDKTKQKSSEILEDIQESEVYKKTTETFDKVGDTVLDTGEKFYDKTKEVLEGPGKEMAEMAKEISEDMGSKIIATGKAVKEKASEVAGKLGDKFDETFQKAQEEAEREKNEPKSEFADNPIDLGKSTLEGKDSFFEKAERYADGAYSDRPTILDEKVEKTEEAEIKDIAGFEDRDNDGDDLVDDAEIVDEENEPS